jgi:hypothetical protein
VSFSEEAKMCKHYELYQKQKRRIKVMAKRRTLDEQIELAQEELRKKEARIKELLGRQRTKADKERTHRLCRRGGLVEKLLPALAIITDEQFESFVERILLTGDAERVLAELTPPAAGESDDGGDASVGDAAPISKNGAALQQDIGKITQETVNTVAHTSDAHNGKSVVADNNGNSNNGGYRGNPVPNTKSTKVQHNSGSSENHNNGNGSRNTGQSK